jgi:hypothetical protein
MAALRLIGFLIRGSLKLAHARQGKVHPSARMAGNGPERPALASALSHTIIDERRFQ